MHLFINSSSPTSRKTLKILPDELPKDQPYTFFTHFLYILKKFNGKTIHSSKLSRIHTIVRRMTQSSISTFSWPGAHHGMQQSGDQLLLMCLVLFLFLNWKVYVLGSPYCRLTEAVGHPTQEQWHSHIPVGSAQRSGHAQPLVLLAHENVTVSVTVNVTVGQTWVQVPFPPLPSSMNLTPLSLSFYIYKIKITTEPFSRNYMRIKWDHERKQAFYHISCLILHLLFLSSLLYYNHTI